MTKNNDNGKDCIVIKLIGNESDDFEQIMTKMKSCKRGLF